MPEVEQVMPKGKFSIMDIYVDLIKKEIKSVQCQSHSVGWNISDFFLEMRIDVICDTLAFMMIFPIRAGDVAAEWENPQNKSLWRCILVNNYRPLSVLPVISKSQVFYQSIHVKLLFTILLITGFVIVKLENWTDLDIVISDDLSCFC